MGADKSCKCRISSQQSLDIDERKRGFVCATSMVGSLTLGSLLLMNQGMKNRLQYCIHCCSESLSSSYCENTAALSPFHLLSHVIDRRLKDTISFEVHSSPQASGMIRVFKTRIQFLQAFHVLGNPKFDP
ncbi:uncharacterized protein B0T23DRAFT_397319 [Neurospora hispaniola]|uniref:Uncharacterized protein n=1 Tax=Neurospora hispaniola TaxID=588809 RepID=A0AAJ0I2S8_9PEZI|nr:hypothetical protein B0T23DRAFT_397319 [Neurospora hispaniola]